MGNFIKNGHEVRSLGAIGAVAGALALGLGVPQVEAANKAPVIDSLERCIDYQQAQPEVVGAYKSANELPRSILVACGVQQFLEPNDERSRPDSLLMGGSVDYGQAKVVLPNPSLLAEQLESYQIKNDPWLWLLGAGGGFMVFGLVAEHVRDTRRIAKAPNTQTNLTH